MAEFPDALDIVTHPLERAMILAARAVDGNGLKVFLVSNPFDENKVRIAMLRLAESFTNGSVFLGAEGEYAAAKNLSLLANLLAEHIRERTRATAA
jgi:hypothetical protein